MSATDRMLRFILDHPYFEHDKVTGEPTTTPRIPRVDSHKNATYHGSYHNDRYVFDFRRCRSADGWRQYDTSQDAHYFGVWVHMAERLVFTYCEGDISLVVCPTPEGFKAELDRMAEFYGSPPPAFIVYDTDARTRTEVFDKRPDAAEVEP